MAPLWPADRARYTQLWAEKSKRVDQQAVCGALGDNITRRSYSVCTSPGLVPLDANMLIAMVAPIFLAMTSKGSATR